MRTTRTAYLILASLVALWGCEANTAFEPITGPVVSGGPTLTFRGTVRSRDGVPVVGARVRLYAPGDPFEFPYTVASTFSTTGGAYILNLPSEFSLSANCDVWHLSARAFGYGPEGDVAGILCTSDVQEFDFTLIPVPSS